MEKGETPFFSGYCPRKKLKSLGRKNESREKKTHSRRDEK